MQMSSRGFKKGKSPSQDLESTATGWGGGGSRGATEHLFGVVFQPFSQTAVKIPDGKATLVSEKQLVRGKNLCVT